MIIFWYAYVNKLTSNLYKMIIQKPSSSNNKQLWVVRSNQRREK